MKKLLASAAIALFVVSPAWADTPNWDRVYDKLTHKVETSITNPEVLCLASNIYFEARSSTVGDKRGVGHVTMNRVTHNMWGKTVCDVVWEKQQFSWTISPPLITEQKQWTQAQIIAALIYTGWDKDNTGGATHFHAKGVLPKWTKDAKSVKMIGSHKYYVLKSTANYEMTLSQPYKVRIASAAWSF